MDLTKLNKVARLDNMLPTKKMSELEMHTDYLISDVKEVKTRYGDKLLVTIDNEYNVFLPLRMSRTLLDDPVLFEHFKKGVKSGSLRMQFLGGKFFQCEFGCVGK